MSTRPIDPIRWHGQAGDPSGSDSPADGHAADPPAVEHAAGPPAEGEAADPPAAAREAEIAAATEAAALDGRRVLIVGLGDSGLAMARWATAKGAVVTVADSRATPPGLDALRATCPDARFISGAFDAGLLDGIELVGWSQGLSPTVGAAAALHAAARAASVPVWGELEFFARELARLRAHGYRAHLVAITGTNGKTTTTRLVGHLCKQAGRRVAVAGNIGPAALDALREAIEHDDLPEVWVLEVASFQLALTESFAADCATILNLTQDHLDWHGPMAEYLAAKQRIYAAGTICVYNRDDPLTVPGATLPAGDGAQPQPAAAASGRPARAAARQPSRRAAGRAEPPRTAIGFGLDEPRDAPGYGVARDAGLAWLVEAVPVDDVPRRRKAAGELRINRLMPADALRIRGAHNHANALAALALCRAIDVPMAAMLHGLRGFRGEPHRCELVAVIRDIEWYDDSKGTNVGATVAALTGLGKRCVLIAGGDGKGQDFAPLAAAVARHASAVLLIGRDAPRIRAALAGTGVPLTDCASLEEAVGAADASVRPGEAVLLSPACASFDMFRNYAHRAQVFVDAVQRIAQRDGQPC